MAERRWPTEAARVAEARAVSHLASRASASVGKY